MQEKNQQLTDLAAELVTPDRQFPQRTPHSYAHTASEAGATVLRRFNFAPTQAPGEELGGNVRSLFPDIPEATIYYFPSREA